MYQILGFDGRIYRIPSSLVEIHAQGDYDISTSNWLDMQCNFLQFGSSVFLRHLAFDLKKLVVLKMHHYCYWFVLASIDVLGEASCPDQLLWQVNYATAMKTYHELGFQGYTHVQQGRNAQIYLNCKPTYGVFHPEEFRELCVEQLTDEAFAELEQYHPARHNALLRTMTTMRSIGPLHPSNFNYLHPKPCNMARPEDLQHRSASWFGKLPEELQQHIFVSAGRSLLVSGHGHHNLYRLTLLRCVCRTWRDWMDEECITVLSDLARLKDRAYATCLWQDILEARDFSLEHSICTHLVASTYLDGSPVQFSFPMYMLLRANAIRDPLDMFHPDVGGMQSFWKERIRLAGLAQPGYFPNANHSFTRLRARNQDMPIQSTVRLRAKKRLAALPLLLTNDAQ
tara:strand:- start:6611 stop:7804 length:1194 start_codon:yes stop_codon:yes gene_type:complete